MKTYILLNQHKEKLTWVENFVLTARNIVFSLKELSQLEVFLSKLDLSFEIPENKIKKLK